jgi:hypothetical protein
LALEFIDITSAAATNTENKWSSWTHSSKAQVICCIFWEGVFGKTLFFTPVFYLAF